MRDGYAKNTKEILFYARHLVHHANITLSYCEDVCDGELLECRDHMLIYACHVIGLLKMLSKLG